jgi:hypothetical protein
VMVNLINCQQEQQHIEGVTDEFMAMVQTSDDMTKPNTQFVAGAELDDGYRYVDERVNRMNREKRQQKE